MGLVAGLGGCPPSRSRSWSRGLQPDAGPLPAVVGVGFGLALEIAAVSGAVSARAAERTPQWAGGVRLAGRRGRRSPRRASRDAWSGRRAGGAARGVVDGGVMPLVIAVSFHLLAGVAGRATAGEGASLAALGYRPRRAPDWPWITKQSCSVLAGGISWSIAAVCATLPVRLRYAARSGTTASDCSGSPSGPSWPRHRVGGRRAPRADRWPGPSARSPPVPPCSSARLMAGESRRLSAQSERLLVRSSLSRVRRHGVGDLPGGGPGPGSGAGRRSGRDLWGCPCWRPA